MAQSSEIGVEEAVDATWDICETAFDKSGEFHHWYRGDLEQYFFFLRRAFAEALSSSKSGNIESIGAVLYANGIDRIALHYRSRRGKWADSIAWQRLVFDLDKLSHSDESRHKETEKTLLPPSIDEVDYYGRKTLPQHAFRKSRRSRVLNFEFTKEDNPQKHETEGTHILIPRGACDVILDCLQSYLSSDSPRKIATLIVDQLQKSHRSFLSALKVYCIENLSTPKLPDNDEDRLIFLVDSSLVTLTLLKRGEMELPRSFLMAPVFVGNEGVGGMAFFSKDSKNLRKCERYLKYLAMNLLTYVAVRESRELEYDRRLLEASSPVVHLFVHSVNKAFTTPILNVCDELNLAADLLASDSWSSSDDSRMASCRRSSERLTAISDYLRSFSRRWSGTFAALGHQPLGENVNRFLELGDFSGDDLKDELVRHVKALFTVQLANDIFDFEEFSEYRPFLESLDGLRKIVNLRFGVHHRIPGQRDVMLLYLVELVQNSLEALPLGEILWKFRRSPRLLKSTGLWVAVTSRESDQNTLAIEVSDNGRGFDEEVVERLKGYLEEFSKPDMPPPNLGDVRQRMDEEGHSLSTKSGGALGLGLLGMADYVSRICCVEWQKRTPDTSYYSDDHVRVVQRGKVEIETTREGQETGSTVRILLPRTLVTSDSDKEQRLLLERRQ